MNQLLHVFVVEATSIASILDSAHTRFTAAQKQLLAAVSAANQAGLHVSDTGAVSAPPATPADRHDPMYAPVMAQNVATAEADIAAALKAANEADGKVSKALGTVSTDSTAAFSGRDIHPVVDAAQAAKTAAELAGFQPGQISRTPGGWSAGWSDDDVATQGGGFSEPVLGDLEDFGRGVMRSRPVCRNISSIPSCFALLADDFVVLCESRAAAEQVKARLTGWLAERGLGSTRTRRVSSTSTRAGTSWASPSAAISARC